MNVGTPDHADPYGYGLGSAGIIEFLNYNVTTSVLQIKSLYLAQLNGRLL
jgi:hypothetical protein